MYMYIYIYTGEFPVLSAPPNGMVSEVLCGCSESAAWMGASSTAMASYGF